MPDELPTPLGGPPPPEVPLPRAPLVRVVAEVRLPGIIKIDSKDGVAALQEEVRADYPIFEQEPAQQVQLQLGVGQQPLVQHLPTNVWRFLDADRKWRFSLNPTSVALDTELYTSRADFLARWSKALASTQKIFSPQIALRQGMRFIDRIIGEPMNTIDTLLRPGVLGVITPALRPHVRQALTEATLRIAEGEMVLRWGILPPGTTIDPGLLPPTAETSWILDIDAYTNAQGRFDTDGLVSTFGHLAARAYSVFRFMTTEQFLNTYGASQ